MLPNFSHFLVNFFNFYFYHISTCSQKFCPPTQRGSKTNLPCTSNKKHAYLCICRRPNTQGEFTFKEWFRVRPRVLCKQTRESDLKFCGTRRVWPAVQRWARFLSFVLYAIFLSTVLWEYTFSASVSGFP